VPLTRLLSAPIFVKEPEKSKRKGGAHAARPRGRRDVIGHRSTPVAGLVLAPRGGTWPGTYMSRQDRPTRSRMPKQ
jgi:hypothetical protein